MNAKYLKAAEEIAQRFHEMYCGCSGGTQVHDVDAPIIAAAIHKAVEDREAELTGGATIKALCEMERQLERQEILDELPKCDHPDHCEYIRLKIEARGEAEP